MSPEKIELTPEQIADLLAHTARPRGETLEPTDAPFSSYIHLAVEAAKAAGGELDLDSFREIHEKARAFYPGALDNAVNFLRQVQAGEADPTELESLQRRPDSFGWHYDD